MSKDTQQVKKQRWELSSGLFPESCSSHTTITSALEDADRVVLGTKKGCDLCNMQLMLNAECCLKKHIYNGKN